MPLQLHYVMDKQAVKRGHILAVEGRPCMGMYFILEGQVWLQLVLLAVTCIPGPIGHMGCLLMHLRGCTILCMQQGTWAQLCIGRHVIVDK